VNTKNLILLLAFFTLVGFPAIGYLIFYFFGESNLSEILNGEIPISLQLLYGFPIGWFSAVIATKLIQADFMKPVRVKYGNMIAELKLNNFQIIFISICAGVGEELLFRASLQPIWGVWITSLVFVALHGYLNPFDWRITVYGIYLTLVIIGLGFMFIFWGIWASAAAHTAIDIALLYFLTKSPLNHDEHFD
jgi:membrane protease YdiL (CAAX protease family)